MITYGNEWSFFSAKGIISSFRGYALSHPLHFDRIDKKSIDFCYQFTSVKQGSAAL